MSSSFSQDVWEMMRNQLIPFFGDGLHIVISESWSDQYEAWFKEIEVESFRESLRYNTEELKTRLNEEKVLLLFMLVNECPKGVILGYPVKRERGDTFYLDTFAIKTRGKGIGKIVLRFIIQWAKSNGFSVIELDTEAENEVGFPLQRFYEGLGFTVQRVEDDGNITMILNL
jgi:ribosomal protein S18 acetylase RimI-like enzyme